MDTSNDSSNIVPSIHSDDEMQIDDVMDTIQVSPSQLSTEEEAMLTRNEKHNIRERARYQKKRSAVNGLRSRVQIPNLKKQLTVHEMLILSRNFIKCLEEKVQENEGPLPVDFAQILSDELKPNRAKTTPSHGTLTPPTSTNSSISTQTEGDSSSSKPTADKATQVTRPSTPVAPSSAGDNSNNSTETGMRPPQPSATPFAVPPPAEQNHYYPGQEYAAFHHHFNYYNTNYQTFDPAMPVAAPYPANIQSSAQQNPHVDATFLHHQHMMYQGYNAPTAENFNNHMEVTQPLQQDQVSATETPNDVSASEGSNSSSYSEEASSSDSDNCSSSDSEDLDESFIYDCPISLTNTDYYNMQSRF